MKNIIVTVLSVCFSSLLFGQPKQITDEASRRIEAGKKHFALKVDDDIREYYVHIPRGYNAADSLPVVIVLHGSGGDGQKFYNISGWAQEGDTANFIAVFPSSWKYDCIIDDSIKKHNSEKWNDYTLNVCKNNKKRDDIKFLNKVIDELQSKYAVDTKRIYMVGFSNGGSMAARCAIELSNRLAAIVSCAGALPPNFNTPPLRKLPLMLQIGASDDKLMANLGTANKLPLNIPLLLARYPLIQSVVDSYINTFGLNASYTIQGVPGEYTTANYTGTSGDPRNIFRFAEVKGLDHEYANGKNHPLFAAKMHWNWLKNFTLP